MDRLAGDSSAAASTDWATVSVDLDRVLGPAADAAGTVVPFAQRPAAAPIRRRPRWPLAVLLVMLLAGGLAAAAMFGSWPSIAARPATGIGADVPPARASGLPARRPAVALLAVAAPVRSERSDREPFRRPAIERAGQVVPEAPLARPAVRAVAIRSAAVSAAPGTAPAAGCRDLDGDDLARCLQPRLEVADHRLVDAYAAAAAAGVSRPLLVAVRDRWVDARDGTRFDPRDTLRRYAELTDDLRGMAAQRRVGPGANAE